MADELRKVEKKTPDGWKGLPMQDLRKGDMFRLFEPDGEPVQADGLVEFEAVTDAALSDENVWSVEVDVEVDDQKSGRAGRSTPSAQSLQ